MAPPCHLIMFDGSVIAGRESEKNEDWIDDLPSDCSYAQNYSIPEVREKRRVGPRKGKASLGTDLYCWDSEMENIIGVSHIPRKQTLGEIAEGLYRNTDYVFNWLFEVGDDTRDYGPESPELQEISTSPAATAMRDDFYRNECESNDFGEYGSRRAAFETLRPLWNTSSQVGGFLYTATNNGNGTVTFEFTNVTSLWSAGYHFDFIPRPLPRGGMIPLCGDLSQTFSWTEPIQ